MTAEAYGGQGIDQRERYNDPLEVTRSALEGLQAQIWTALPGFVTAINADGTVQVQPTVRDRFTDLQGKQTWMQLPILPSCIPSFPGGGGVTLTFPIIADPTGKTATECMVHFSARCLDSWWQLGGIQNQPDLRMHDLSDGVAYFGIRSLPRKLPAVSVTGAQLRTDDGTAYIGISPEGNVEVVAPGRPVAVTALSADVIASTIVLIGDVDVIGSLTVNGVPVP